MAELLALIADNTISGKIAKDVFDEAVVLRAQAPREIVEAEGLIQVTDAGRHRSGLPRRGRWPTPSSSRATAPATPSCSASSSDR